MPAYAGAAIALGDTRHHLEPDARVAARLGLLAAAPEHERVAALQAHHFQPGLAALDQQLVDLLLRHGRGARRLADVDELRATRREVEQHARCQPVVDNHVGAPEQLLAASRQQTGITRAGADEVHRHPYSSASSTARPPLPSSRSRAAIAPTSIGSEPVTRVRSTM